MEDKTTISGHEEQPVPEKSQDHHPHSHGQHGAALIGQAHLYQGMAPHFGFDDLLTDDLQRIAEAEF
jgi:hypothetical protein